MLQPGRPAADFFEAGCYLKRADGSVFEFDRGGREKLRKSRPCGLHAEKPDSFAAFRFGWNGPRDYGVVAGIACVAASAGLRIVGGPFPGGAASFGGFAVNPYSGWAVR